jgi:hypothetical protein
MGILSFGSQTMGLLRSHNHEAHESHEQIMDMNDDMPGMDNP